MKLRTLLSMALCGALLLTGCTKPAPTPSGSGSASGSGTTPEQPEPAATIEVQLYLPNENVDGFDIVTETATDDLLTLPNQLIAALVEHGALPSGTSVLSFDMTKSIPPQLRLNLSAEFKDALLRTGTSGEYMLMGSVVNTFLTAYDAEQIVLLSEGETIESGHNVYDQPLTFFQNQNDTDSLFAQCAPDAPENALAVIVNEPFEDSDAGQFLLLQSRSPSNTFSADGKYDRAYIIPRLANSEIELFEIEYDSDSGEFHKSASVFSCKSTADTLIYGSFDRGEVLPRYMLTVSAEGAYGEFVLSYNGRDGTPALEYVCETQ